MKKHRKLHIAKPLSATEIRQGLKISQKDHEAAVRANELGRKGRQWGNKKLIVEIQGIDEERMKKIEEVILPRLGLVNITKTEGFDRKIRLSADTGEAKWVDTHLNMWGAKGVCVYLREPGELALTMEGSLPLVVFIAGALGAADILKQGGELELAKQLEKKTKSRCNK